ncbi:hypothetical protein QL285_064110 [Trifolium repens]|nr:hypothetical protein QL285_064110 [Trifolium repens]
MNNIDAYDLFSFTLEFEWYFLIAINFVGLLFFYTFHGVKFCSTVLHTLIHFLPYASTMVSRKIGMLLLISKVEF